MIIPISLIFASVVAVQKKREAGKGKEVNYSFAKIFPWFILWFLAASLLNTVGIIHGQTAAAISEAGRFFHRRGAFGHRPQCQCPTDDENGFRPMALGLIVWAGVALSSLAVQLLPGRSEIPIIDIKSAPAGRSFNLLEIDSLRRYNNISSGPNGNRFAMDFFRARM
jgi:hypothetical protein